MCRYRILSYGKCDYLKPPVESEEIFDTIYGARSALSKALLNGASQSIHQGITFEMLHHYGQPGQITGVYWAIHPNVDGFSPLGEIFLVEE